VPFLVRQLKQAGANVQVVMTDAAEKFTTKITLAALSGNDVIAGIFPRMTQIS